MAATALRALMVEASDTVGVALCDLDAGEVVSVGGRTVQLSQAIPRGHKFAVAAHAVGSPIVKYGAQIGIASQSIAAGEHVHAHNIRSALSGVEEYSFAPVAAKLVQPASGTFQGYRRANGRVGTRNEIWIIATVGCVANTCTQIAKLAAEKYKGQIDGIHAITHPFGCSQLGDDLKATKQILASLACHPNVGGVLFVGLGCESNQVNGLLAAAPDLEADRVRVVRAQTEGDELDAGLAAVDELVARARGDRRTPCSVADLVIGLKCGGSDGLSGLTANPLLGRLTEGVVAAGGSAILTEIPEIFGAERALMARAVDHSVFEKIAALTNGFKSYFLGHNQPVHENPSPGNKEGGISTLEEKSLGAVQKAGAAPVADAIDYAERIGTSGLTLLQAPGNDAVSGTALVAAGATIVLFTTGRGTPLGFPAPTIKIASNSELAERKARWIDFDAGALLTGKSWSALESDLLQCVLAVANGAPTANETNGERSIAIWKGGVTL
jgi:altronate hydrolase